MQISVGNADGIFVGEKCEKNHNLCMHIAQKQNAKLELLTKLTFNGKLHKIGTQKKRKEVVIRRNYQSS